MQQQRFQPHPSRNQGNSTTHNQTSTGKIPILIEKIVWIEIPAIAETAIHFIKANRFPYYSVEW
ncbi:MAG: hypothetical protein AB4080_21935 [Trichodesmium sp.]